MKKKFLKKILTSLLLIVLALLISVVIYMLIPRTASEAAKSKITNPTPNITTEYNENEIVCSPKNSSPDTGIIFYTGAKIEHYAYGHMLANLADNNILCIAEDNLVHIPLFNNRDCESIFERYPNIKNWYFAGHSVLYNRWWLPRILRRLWNYAYRWYARNYPRRTGSNIRNPNPKFCKFD